MPGISIQDIISVRDRTNLSLADSRRLLESTPVVDDAVSKFATLRDKLKQTRALYRKKSTSFTDEWWMRDFVSREPSALTSSSDPDVKSWGVQLESFQQKLNGLTKRRIRRLADYENALWISEETERAVEEHVRQEAWNHAFLTHKIPKFEPNWLGQLSFDPFRQLRPAKEAKVAERLLEKNASFDFQSDKKRAKTVAASVEQAEQYYIASLSSDLSVKPLLVYYMVTNLCRAVLAFRIKRIFEKYGAHGLKRIDGKIRPTIRGFKLRPTATEGLFHAIYHGLPGGRINDTDGPWALLDVLKFVPELSSMLYECFGVCSNSHILLDYEQHESNGVSLPYNHHVGPVLPFKYLEEHKILDKSHLDRQRHEEAIERVISSFPGGDWSLSKSYAGEYIHLCRSPSLNGVVVAAVRLCGDRHDQLRLFPLLYEGGIGGSWYVVFNRKRERPHQLAILYTIMYGLSMLVRYFPAEWKNLIANDDGTRAIIEEVTRIAQIKAPIIATEWMYSRRVLGSLDIVPH